MRLNQFRAERKLSLQTSTIQSTDRNSPTGKIGYRERRQNPFIIRKAKFIIQYIKQRSTPEHCPENFQSQDSPVIGQKEKQFQEETKQQTQQTGQTLPIGNRKISRNFSSIDSERNFGNSRIQLQLQKRKEAFLKHYGYLQNKHSTIALAKQKRQTIQIVPNIQQCNQRLYLDEVQEMKLQRTIRQNTIKAKGVRRTKRQKQILNRTINEVEIKLSQEQGRQTKQSVSFEKTKKMLSAMSIKTKKQIVPFQITKNINQVMNNISRCSNRIYGKRNQPDSIAWCCQVLKAQLEDQFLPYASIIEKRKKRQQGRQAQSFTLSPVKRNVERKSSIYNN